MTIATTTATLPAWRDAGPTTALRSNGTEWVSADLEPLRERNALITVTLSGAASAAGISFGAFKDFLVPIDSSMGERRLQLEIDAYAKSWAFRADGVQLPRAWWDAAVRSVDDFFDGVLALKARYAEEVVFRDLSIVPFQSSPRVSVVMTCYRFAQRLRVALTGWCRQRVPAGTLEVIVINPESPDGTHELLASMAAAYPEVRLHEIQVADALGRNKGYMLNRGIGAARGEWIWLTDADCLFPPDAASQLLGSGAPADALLFGERRHLSKSSTDRLLAGRLDPAGDFGALADEAAGRATDIFPWGFTQILHRSQIDRVRYREDLDHFAGSDGSFVESCRQAGLVERRLGGLTCLHLHHPFAWYGTRLFL